MEGDITSRMSDLVIQIGVLIFAVRLFGFLAKKARISSVLGELIAGVVVGPYALGSIPLPGFPSGIFSLNSVSLAVTPELYGFSTVASIILLFASGLETDLALFLRYSLAGGVIGLGGVVASFLLGDAAGMMLFGCGMMDVRCLFLGIMSTATSVGITARILSDKKKMDSPEGVTILASAVFDDVLGIILLAVVMGIVAAIGAGGGQVSIDGAKILLIAARAFGIWLVFTAAGLLLSKKIARFLKIFKHSYDFSICALGIALILGGFFEKQGLAMIIGAYITGLSLSATDIAAIIQERIHGLYKFFVPLFFAVMGMMVNMQKLMSREVLAFGAFYTVLAVAAKVVGCGLPALGFGFNLKGALRIGCGMIPRGEVALIIAGIGLTAGILDEQMFGVVILMTLVTTLFAPPLIAASLSISGKGTKKETRSTDNVAFTWDFGSDEIADLVIDIFLKDLRSEGFYVQMMNISEGISQARKDGISLSITETESVVKIETSAEDSGFVKNAMYEVLIRLGNLVQNLKENYVPEKINFFDQSEMSRTSADILKLFAPDAVSLDLKGTTKDQILQEMVMLLANSGAVRNWETVLADVRERENIMSTGMQHGVAFPHGKSDAVIHTCVALGISRNGVDFDSLDGEKCKVFVMIVSPKKTSSPHMLLLSSLSYILRDEKNVEELLKCSDVKSLFEKMKKFAARKNNS